ncbi:MAG: S-layer homology domain-containing protein, partial [Plesiomonas sp.]
GANGQNYVTVSVSGPVYGYDSPYAKTETQKRRIMVTTPESQYAIEETPTYTMHKDIQYGANEPEAMSFGGNYKEMIRGEGSNTFNMLVADPALYDDEMVGSYNATDTARIEQLPIPALPQLKGHPAQSEITKLYSLGIISQPATAFSPSRVVTKGDYITMLVKAFHLPLPEPDTKKKKNETPAPPVFSDLSESSSYYPYAMAAYTAGLIGGGRFDGKTTLTREQLYVYNMRMIGLERLGIGTLGVYTPFVDDKQISSWAKTSVYAATRIGLIPVANGYLYPQRAVTYADAAAMMNQLLTYMRYDLQRDFNEKMIY